MFKNTLCGLLLLSMHFGLLAQETFPTNDVRDNREGAFALTNMTLVVDYQTTIETAVLLIRDGFVEKAGKDLSIPKGYAVIDLKDKYVYPSWIDPYTQYGISENENPSSGSPYSATEQITSKTKGAFNANEAVKSETNASELFSSNDESAAKLRAAGFGAVLTFQADGLARGTSSLVSLNTELDNKSLLMSKAATHYSFTKGSSKQTYPISKMGFIALLRQTYLDAEWYANQDPPPFIDLSLEAWNATQSLPQVFDTNGWLEILRADKLGDEFGVQYIIKGGGDEYQRINEVKSTGAPLIIPINFPKPFDVEDPLDAQKVSLGDMKHWELAPTNPAILENNDVTFAFTADGLKSSDEYLPNIRKAIENGLSESAALKAMTHTPAAMVNAAELVGSLKENRLANFIITSKPIFEEKAIILETWVQGKRYAFKELEHPDLSGKYDLVIGQNTYPLEIDGEPGNQKAKIRVSDTTEIAVSSKMDKASVTFAFSPPEEEGAIRLSGWLEEGALTGRGQLIDGTWVDWMATRTGDADPEKTKPKDEKDAKPLGEVIYPFIGHGNLEVPQRESLLIKNATLWTNEAEGIMEETDILIEDGKISRIGPNLSAPAARTIDATGKHVTSGIIDEHSHIAATSINDLATNSSMVRMNDVINPTDINIYAALSGGVTAVQILHGSANPIGGQSAIIKLRWGKNPEEMKIKAASPFIKFALGENVKRSGNTNSVRYPQTRMGVEQVYVDAFTNAADYLEKLEAYGRLSAKAKSNELAPRRDLAMETIGEILRGERYISCHSYVQSEINMLLKVAEKFDFRVNTFTHILEGYKVADIMKAHGAGASTFSDWYAYKWEVRYAIPYNAAIMHQAGLTVAINSDDAEMGRRLNQEAAKAVKYGGVSQEEAWKMVTLNPAKLLHLDQTMGSLKVGKDADVVIWTDNPLSVYAKVEKTVLDGTIYYDAHKDAEMNKWILAEKARLIQKMNQIKKEGGPTQKAKSKTKHYFHCDDLTVDTKTLNF
ncbi:MAG: amidohydrolase family protein [Cyclobacteriaceae bacterium]